MSVKEDINNTLNQLAISEWATLISKYSERDVTSVS